MFYLKASNGHEQHPHRLIRPVLMTVTLLLVPVANGQRNSVTEPQRTPPAQQRQLPLPPSDAEKSTPPTGAKAQLTGPIKFSGLVEIRGPFREGTGRAGPFPARGEDDTVDAAQQLEPRGPGASASSKISVQVAAGLELAGTSAVEAASKLPASGSIKPFSGGFGESLLPSENMRSPALTTFWQNGANQNGGGDPQVAVSRTTVGVLTWSALAFYDKSGTPLPGTDTFQNPTNMPTLFANVLPAVDASLNLNPAVAGNSDFKMCQAPGNCHDVGDARIVFDAIHNRWVVVATAKNDPPNKDLYSSNLVKTQRRTKFLLAVSVDEDPFNGFYTYFFNATPDDGACNSTDASTQCPNSAFTPGNAGDYPSVGISDKHYMFTVHADHPGGSWAYLVTVNAQDVMNGLPNPHGHAFWEWDVGDGEKASFVTMPVVNQDKISPLDKGMIIDTHGERISVTTVSNSDPPVLQSAYWDMPKQQSPTLWSQKGSLEKINDGNVGNKPLNAVEMNGTLVAVFNDCRTWVDSQHNCSPSIHLVSADVGLLPIAGYPHISRVIGWRNIFDDSPNDVVAYGMPGIAMNKDNDIAVVYTRSSPLLFPEVRYSAWLHGEMDIRPSRPMIYGQGPIPAPDPTQPASPSCQCLVTGNCPKNTCIPLRTDTAGIAVDPFDHTAIWMGHLYADLNGGYSMTVGKVFGKPYPDLMVPKVAFAPGAARPGDTVKVKFTVHNGGDGATTNVKAEIRLVPLTTTPQPKISLGEDAIPGDLASGASVDRTFSARVPDNTDPGRYAIEVEAKIRGGDTTEYSLDNNTGQARILAVLPNPAIHPAPLNSSVLLPDSAFQGGLLTGVVLGPDDQPVANTPVEITGGVAAELTGEVIGEASPCPPDQPNCQREKPARKTIPGAPPEPPVECAAVLRKAGEAARPTTTSTTALPSAVPGSGGLPQLVTDSAGRFAVCVSPTSPELSVNLPGGGRATVKSDRDLSPAPERPPDFLQPGQKISLNGLVQAPEASQGGRTWPLPVVHAWSPDGRRSISALRMPRELLPGPVQLSYTDNDGRRLTVQGSVFKILRAFLDHSQLHSNQGATFEYEVQFVSSTNQALCVEMHVDGPIVLLQAPPEVIAIDANGLGRFGGKIRATQVTPGVSVPFNINPHIHVCGN
jgi:hypothetical protein